MNTFVTKDGTTIYFKDWGSGPVVTFSHGWPLSADAWDAQMLFLAKRGYRVVAHDRRGHGRSGHSWQGNNMDQYADDLAELMNHLDLENATMVGHSTGGGEVVRYIARHGQKRVMKRSHRRGSAADAQDGEESGGLFWENKGSSGTFYTASSPSIRYKDGEEWKTGSSYGALDLLALQEAAREASAKIRELAKNRGQSR